MPQYDFSQPLDLNKLPASIIYGAATDPATAWAGAPPLMGQDIVPHFYTSTGYVGSAARAYPIEDEATRNSVENAIRMRTECGIMECLEARQRASALLKWHLVPENEKSPKQQELCQVLSRILDRTPRFVEYRRCLLEALWYGKYGVVNNFGSTRVGGKYRTVITDWSPRNGDKLVFRYDDGTYRYMKGQLGIRVHANFAYQMQPKFANMSEQQRRQKIEPTQYGLVYWFDKYERETMVVHKHMVEDGPWHEPHMMGRVMGVGIRDRIYWTWYAMQALLQDLLTFVSRAALGVRLWRYPSGNEKWKEKIESAAKDAIANGVADILFPVEPNEYASMYGVEQIEPGIGGAQMIKELIEGFFLRKIKKYILGQLLTSEAEATGLGSGVAEAHLATFSDIIRYDAANLQETLTEQLVRKLQRENAPKSMGVHVRLLLDTDSPDTERRLAAIQAAYQMDVPIKSEDIYQLTGLSKPEPQDHVISVSIQQEKQQKQQTEMMMEQQAMMGGMGQPGMEGGEEPVPEGPPEQATMDVSPENVEGTQGPSVPADGELEEKAAMGEPQTSTGNPWSGFWESFFAAARGETAPQDNPTEPDYELETQETLEAPANPELTDTFTEMFDDYVDWGHTVDEFKEDVQKALERHDMTKEMSSAMDVQAMAHMIGKAFDRHAMTETLSELLHERIKAAQAMSPVESKARQELLDALNKRFGYVEAERYSRKAWTPYRGSRGGRGWKNVGSGEVRYQEKSPDYDTGKAPDFKSGNGKAKPLPSGMGRIQTPEPSLGWVGILLDGVLAKETNSEEIGEPNAEAVELAKKLIKHGVNVKIFTQRVADPETERPQRRRIKTWAIENIGQDLPITAKHDQHLIRLVDELEENEQEKYSMSNADIDEAVSSWKAPSEAQIEAENYRKPRVRLLGLEIAVENPKGTSRKEGWQPLANHYGYISRVGSKSAPDARDDDKLDVFVCNHPESEIIFVVDQETQGGRFDEHKIMLGCTNAKNAKESYLANYPSGWRCGPITAITADQLRAWMEHGDTDKRIADQVSKYMAAWADNPERYARKRKFDPKQSSFDFDAPKESKASPWVPYQGPKGGKGWQRQDNGIVVYQTEKPGDDEHAGKRPEPPQAGTQPLAAMEATVQPASGGQANPTGHAEDSGPVRKPDGHEGVSDDDGDENPAKEYNITPQQLKQHAAAIKQNMPKGMAPNMRQLTVAITSAIDGTYSMDEIRQWIKDEPYDFIRGYDKLVEAAASKLWKTSDEGTMPDGEWYEDTAIEHVRNAIPVDTFIKFVESESGNTPTRPAAQEERKPSEPGNTGPSEPDGEPAPSGGTKLKGLLEQGSLSESLQTATDAFKSMDTKQFEAFMDDADINVWGSKKDMLQQFTDYVQTLKEKQQPTPANTDWLDAIEWNVVEYAEQHPHRSQNFTTQIGRAHV